MADHEITQRVTRNMPPKRGVVTEGTTIVFAGQAYHGGDEILAPGPELDQLALQGQVVISSHNEVDAWNGKEGRAIHKRALEVVAADGEVTHDHGFGKYEHADPDHPIPVDLTAHRGQVAQQNLLHGRAATEEDFQ